MNFIGFPGGFFVSPDIVSPSSFGPSMMNEAGDTIKFRWLFCPDLYFEV